MAGSCDCVRLSPDGERVACGRRDGTVATYSTAGGRARVWRVAKARITSIDWDADSRRLRVATSTRELVWRVARVPSLSLS